jgi:hypothetical protein
MEVQTKVSKKVSFEEYKDWITKYVNNNDTREINFQNDVVKRLLENLSMQYSVIYVDTKGSDSRNHDYYKYSGKYIDNKGREKPTTPDLLVAENWNWYNVNNDKIRYIATLEVKSPYSNNAIYKKDFIDYLEPWKRQLCRHLSASEICMVIYTDAFKWEFYKKSNQSELEMLSPPEKTICLVNRVKKGRVYTWEWKNDKEVKNDFETLLLTLKDVLGIEK